MFTADELIAALQSLTPKQRKLFVYTIVPDSIKTLGRNNNRLPIKEIKVGPADFGQLIELNAGE
ncbi:MAG: hypothetical protein ACREHG_11095 [Candidatus Saccharimonadales bacterium]